MNFVTRRLAEYRRIIKIAKKPSKQEFERILKISGLGIIVIGSIGFVMRVIYELIKGVTA